MPTFLEKPPFSSALPESQELLSFLSSNIYEVDEIKQLYITAGGAPQFVRWGRPPDLVWDEVLLRAVAMGVGVKLIETIGSAQKWIALGGRLKEFLSDTKPAVTRNSKDKELLLKGKWERRTGANPTLLDVAFLSVGAARAKSVVRINAGFSGGSADGTAFFIAKNRVLTNHHVLFEAGAPAGTASLIVGYENDERGKPLNSRVVMCKAETIRGSAEHDWAVVDLETPMVDVVPLSLSTNDGIAEGQYTYIVQHPFGGPKKIALAHNEVTYVDDHFVRYLTDTEGGSSGSPVFNDKWEVVALHHSWVAMSEGDPLSRYRNEGIRIERVAEELRASDLL